MRRRLGWVALVAVLTVPAALAWAGGMAHDKQGAPAHQEECERCCCCPQDACPKK